MLLNAKNKSLCTLNFAQAHKVCFVCVFYLATTCSVNASEFPQYLVNFSLF
ncbi:hypothetical protein HMPREF3232_01215 [Fannyhessea vaginae]|nr:hypothetical protein HMPREF3232_01215 [Fannyhessea vaginae]